MKNIFLNKVNAGLVGAALLLGLSTSCSDDHFDVVVSDASANQTIWQQIESNPNLQDFAGILKQVRVMKDHRDVKSQQTYSDLLNSAQTFTVWAPLDGTYDPQTYLDRIQAAADTASVDPLAAARIEYDLSNQFVRNHMARFNYEGATAAQQVRMMNSKFANYDQGAGTFNNVELNGSFVSSNGMLHTLNGTSPFAYNIYDYMSSMPNYSTLYGILSDPAVDRNVFSPAWSTEGAMNEKGEMVYIDSVYINTNDILNATGAQIKNEDSTYVALIPMNEAWDEGFEKVSELFKVGASYKYDWDNEDRKFNKTYTPKASERDSLVKLNTNEKAIGSMFFSVTNWPIADTKDSASVVNHVLNADSLITTNGAIFYNKNGLGNANPMFANLPVYKASNGYIFSMNGAYTIDPAYAFVQRQEFLSGYNVANTVGTRDEHAGEYIVLSAENRNVKVAGELENNAYYYFKAKDKSQIKLRFRLNNILSTKYKISVQMVPNSINIYHIETDKNGDTIVEKPTFSAQILDDGEKTVGKKVTIKGVSQDKIETVVLWEEVEFPKSYVGLPTGYESFPMLELAMTVPQQTSGKCTAFSIGKIIIEPVRE